MSTVILIGLIVLPAIMFFLGIWVGLKHATDVRSKAVKEYHETLQKELNTYQSKMLVLKEQDEKHLEEFREKVKEITQDLHLLGVQKPDKDMYN